MSDAMRDWLVFEASDQGVGQAPAAHYEAMERSGMSREHLAPYVCLGAVRATDEGEAVKAVMAYTRRIGKYAVIPASIVNFAFTPDQQAEGKRWELNP
jgi:hypothetical protein